MALSSRLILSAAMAAIASTSSAPSPFASVSCPADVPLSCHNTTAYDNTCCFEAPGGQVLLTQFWDTDPSTGPANSWTVHGLWPDNCDGSYEEYCAPEREVHNITDILAEAAPCTLEYMQTFWKDYQGDDEDFWEHEFNKHATCMSSLEPACYPELEGRQDVVDYFKRAVKTFKTLPSYQWLSEAGIVPSTESTYTLAAIQTALTKHHGHNVIINCNKQGELNELWYHYNIKGSVQTGEFVAADPVGSPSSCKASGIKYLPKYADSAPSTTTTTSEGSTPTGAPGQLSGKGRLEVSTEGSSSDGFLISGGTWYRGGGTPATYTASPNSDGKTFSLKTSKGKCAVQDDVFSCASSVSSASEFGYDGTYLTYDGSNTFYSTEAPSGTAQGVVYTTKKAVSFKASWKSS